VETRFQPDGGRPVRGRFGISGASPWQVLGLFFDAYDRVRHPEVTWDKGRWSKGYPRGAYGHYCADLNLEYVREGDFDYAGLVADGKALLGERAVIHAHTMEIPVRDISRMQGEYCVYLLGNVVSETERQVGLVIGTNEALKIWLNGEMVHSSDEKRAFVPMARSTQVTLKAGVNRLVFKALRRGDGLRLAAQFRQSMGEPQGRNIQWVTDLAWRLE